MWADKTGRAAAVEPSLQMRFGTYAEEFVAREYTQQTGRQVQRFNAMLHHPTAPILGNIDRLVIPAGQKRASHKAEIRTDRLLEAKTASAFAASGSDEWGDAGTDLIPPSYLVQVATYMMLTGCQYADLAVLFGNQEVRVYTIRRDLELEQEIVARAAEWWQRHVVADVAPEPVCAADLKRLYPADNGSAVEANREALELLARAAELKQQIDLLEIELNGSKTASDGRAKLGVLGSLKAFMGEAARLVLAGDELVTWKAAKASAKTDWKQAFMDATENLTDSERAALVAAYTATSPGSRRFLIKSNPPCKKHPCTHSHKQPPRRISAAPACWWISTRSPRCSRSPKPCPGRSLPCRRTSAASRATAWPW